MAFTDDQISSVEFNPAIDRTLDQGNAVIQEEDAPVDELGEIDNLPEENEGEQQTAPEQGGEDDMVDVFQFTYNNEYGEQLTEELTQEQLADIIAEHKLGTKDKVVQQMQPIINQIQNSQLLQDMLYWKGRGVPDEEIRRGIAMQLQQAAPQQQQAQEPEPEFETDEQRIQYLVDKKVKEMITPLHQQQQKMEEMRAFQEISSNNNFVFEKALNKYGYTGERLSESQKQKLSGEMLKWYSERELPWKKFSMDQADIIVKSSLGYRQGYVAEQKKQQQATTARNIVNTQSGRPQVLPIRNTVKTQSAQVQPKRLDGFSAEQRLKTYQELMGSNEKK